MDSIPKISCDVLIIGSGAAGLSLALRLKSCYKIAILSKGSINECSTFYAQGGIAAVYDKRDSIASHVEDTINAGAGIVDKCVAEFVANNSKHCVKWLIKQGVMFDIETQLNGIKQFHLTREGGHSCRRILHSADKTGKEIAVKLINAVLKCTNIKVIKCFVVDLIVSDKIGISGTPRAVGVWAWNQIKKQTEVYQAKVVVLATGGASKVYRYSTNPNTSSGDGIAIAWRAGCRVANLEFNQFHPTTLFHPKKQNFLLTEALRGEGAYLKRPDGTCFMQDFDDRREMAPRDIVARAILHEMHRLKANFMNLDISHKPANFIIQHFPNIYKKLLKIGINLTKDLIPIVPAAHYTCGGVMVDNNGRTDLERLYAIGEVSYTGLHGANRMASNSLLECIVYGWSAAEDINKLLPYISHCQAKYFDSWHGIQIKSLNEIHIVQLYLSKLRTFMWDYVGIMRSSEKIKTALEYIYYLKKRVHEYYDSFYFSNELLELRNLVQVSELIAKCAIIRKESRGLHYTLDYPEPIKNSKPSVLSPFVDVKKYN